MFCDEGYIKKKRLALPCQPALRWLASSPDFKDALGQPHLKGKNYGS
jgi:hypothetical protein